jgi:hypothetical protein
VLCSACCRGAFMRTSRQAEQPWPHAMPAAEVLPGSGSASTIMSV